MPHNAQAADPGALCRFRCQERPIVRLSRSNPGRQRTLTTLKTFWKTPQGAAAAGIIGHQGWFYHFLDLRTGWRAWKCELSSIDTALFLAGALYAREYFDQPEV